MHLVVPATRTKFLHLETFGGLLFVFGR